jgi:hypothetical protein
MADLHTVWRVVVGVVLGGTALWLTLRGINASVLAQSLASADPLLVAASLLATLGGLLAVVARWKLLFHPHHQAVSFWQLFRAMSIGQMLNILLPIRAGEIARFYAATGPDPLGAGRVLATLAVEKALEIGLLAFATALLTVMALAPPALLQGGWNRAAMVAVMLVLFYAASRAATAVASRLPQKSWWLPGAIRAAVLRVGTDFRDGLVAANQPRLAAVLVAWSLVAMLLSTLANYLLFRAFGLSLPFSAALLLLVVLQVGTVPPSLPGRLGVFNYLTVLTLGIYGVERGPAAAYSLGLYIVAYLPKVLIGAACLARRDWRRTARGLSGARGASGSARDERIIA